MKLFIKSNFYKYFLISLLIFNLTACGGGGSSKSKTSDDTTPPAFINAVIANSSPSDVKAEFSENIIIEDSAGFIIKVDSSPATITGIIGDDSEIVTFTLALPVEYSETVTIEYDGTGDVTDAAGNLLAEFSSKPVTNNVAYMFSSEGYATAPVNLGTLPASHSGEAADTALGSSYYSIIVVSGYKYRISISELSDNADLYVYINSSFTSLYLNGSSTNNGTYVDSVIITAADTTIYIRVDGSNIAGDGTFFTLSVTAYHESEGSVPAPFTLGDAPADHFGSVDNTDSSYYTVTVNTAYRYQIRLTGLTDNADLYVYNDSGYSILYADGSSTELSTSDESVIIDPEFTILYIKVDSSNITGEYTYYNIIINESLKSEGKIDNPVSLGTTPGTFNNRLVGNISYSYYSIGITNIGRRYQIQMTAMSDNADIYVYSDSSFNETYLQSYSASNGTTSETVVVDATGSTLYIEVRFSNSTIGTYYNITVEEIFYREGEITDPSNFTAPVLNETSCVNLNGDSFYSIDISSGIYTISITEVTSDITVRVFSNSNFSNYILNQLKIYTATSNFASSEFATVLSTDNKIYIQVTQHYGGDDGAYFKFSVSEYTGGDKKAYYISTFDNNCSELTSRADTFIELYNSDATPALLLSNNNWGLAGYLFSELVYPLSPGTYYILIYSFSELPGRYSIWCGETRHSGVASSGNPPDPDNEDTGDQSTQDDIITNARQLNLNSSTDRTIDSNDAVSALGDFFYITIPTP